MSSDDEPFDYVKLRQDITRAVARVCPSWMADRREDLVQIAVMRVMQIAGRRPPAGGGEADARLTTSYLYKVAYSVLVDELRRMKGRRETGLDDEATGPVAVVRENPEQLAASREVGRAIQDCLARMGRDRRLAVTLHLQGHSVPDAARILDWAAKRTENLVYRGLADLRACLLSKGIRP